MVESIMHCLKVGEFQAHHPVNTKKEVPYDKIVKGYKYEDDYVIVEDADFEAAAPEKSKVIKIESFVELLQSIPCFMKHLITLNRKQRIIKLMRCYLKL